jgi:hypothetical protein
MHKLVSNKADAQHCFSGGVAGPCRKYTIGSGPCRQGHGKARQLQPGGIARGIGRQCQGMLPERGLVVVAETGVEMRETSAVKAHTASFYAVRGAVGVKAAQQHGRVVQVEDMQRLRTQ